MATYAGVLPGNDLEKNRRASAAFIKGVGSMGSGYGIAATVLRTWKQPWSISPNTTYIGGEVLIMPVFFTGPRVGVEELVNKLA